MPGRKFIVMMVMNSKLKIPVYSLIREVSARLQAYFAGNPSYLVSTLEQLIPAEEKSLRPTIVLLVGSIFQADREDLVNLAASIEMLHTATLVHNSLVDETGQSSHRPAVNARFTTSATILAGDLAFASAAQLAAAVANTTVMRRFSETLQFIVNGEITYLFNDGAQGSREAYYDWVHAKTASVFELAAELAATIGLTSPSEIQAAAQYAYNLGMAFQIKRDVLDFVGDPSVSSKPAGTDLLLGNITLPTLLYLEAHPGKFDVDTIRKSNGNGRTEIDELIGAIRQSDALEQSSREADRFLKRGLESLYGLPDTPERAELALLAQNVIYLENGSE
jgi:geranylgeranyl pyrophosphate synthase